MKISYGQKKWGKVHPWKNTRNKHIHSVNKSYGYFFRNSSGEFEYDTPYYNNGELLRLERQGEGHASCSVICSRVSDGLAQFVLWKNIGKC